MSNELKEKEHHSEKTKKKTCFIITPVGDNNSEIRRHIDGVIKEVILPVLENLGFEKSDPIYETCITGSLVKKIIKSVYDSDLVIANLTTQNPNVMYEVALRHAAGKPIIHITSEIKNLPFDINSYNTIEYKNDMLGAIDLKNKLIKSIEQIDFDNPNISNPIIDNLGERVITEIPKSEALFSDVLNELTGSIKHINTEIDRLSSKNNSRSLQRSPTFEQGRIMEDTCSVEIIATHYDANSIDTNSFIEDVCAIFSFETRASVSEDTVEIELTEIKSVNKKAAEEIMYDSAMRNNIQIREILWFSY